VYPVKINTARSKFEITGESDAPDTAASSDEEVQKQALKAKWKELKSEFKSPVSV
jgi:hypothetical protein